MISFIPPPINQTKKCHRCGMLYSINEEFCTHCNNLTDTEVEELKRKNIEEHKGNANLGKLFLYISILVIIGMLIISST